MQSGVDFRANPFIQIENQGAFTQLLLLPFSSGDLVLDQKIRRGLDILFGDIAHLIIQVKGLRAREYHDGGQQTEAGQQGNLLPALFPAGLQDRH